MNQSDRTTRVFALLFLSTGIFAIIGALYTWGEGWLFFQTDLLTRLLPMADLILTGPLSLVTGFGLWYKKQWGVFLGLMVSGIYIFGSTLVYIIVFWNGQPYPFQFIIIPIFGIGTAIGFFIWVNKNQN